MSKTKQVKLHVLTLGGAAAFWATTVITSLFPIAAGYRAAFSNWSIQTVWINSLIAGLLIGSCISYLLRRFYKKIPTKNPIIKSVILSTVALVVAILLIDVPMSLHGKGNAIYYFLIGVFFNAVRFLLLGLVIGCLYKRLYNGDRKLLLEVAAKTKG